MLRGLYIASTAMLAQRKKIDVVSNNLVNAETTGFKKDTLSTSSFNDMLVNSMNDATNKSIGALSYGIYTDQTLTSFEGGTQEQTGNYMDLSIQGNGLFTVQTTRGIRYTSAGDFTVNSNGNLSTKDGYLVMGDNGPIVVGKGEFTVDANGNVAQNGVNIDKLSIVNFDITTALQKDGDNLFMGGNPTANDGQSLVQQGYLEGSNVDVGNEMVSLIEIQRAYEVNQRVLKMIDESLGKAVNEVGRV